MHALAEKQSIAASWSTVPGGFESAFSCDQP